MGSEYSNCFLLSLTWCKSRLEDWFFLEEKKGPKEQHVTKVIVPGEFIG